MSAGNDDSQYLLLKRRFVGQYKLDVLIFSWWLFLEVSLNVPPDSNFVSAQTETDGSASATAEGHKEGIKGVKGGAEEEKGGDEDEEAKKDRSVLQAKLTRLAIQIGYAGKNSIV